MGMGRAPVQEVDLYAIDPNYVMYVVNVDRKGRQRGGYEANRADGLSKEFWMHFWLIFIWLGGALTLVSRIHLMRRSIDEEAFATFGRHKLLEASI